MVSGQSHLSDILVTGTFTTLFLTPFFSSRMTLTLANTRLTVELRTPRTLAFRAYGGYLSLQ